MGLLSTCLISLIFYFEVESKKLTLEWDISNANHFTGFVYKKSNFIRIFPEIKLKTSDNLKVCNFLLISKDGTDLPFLAILKSQDNIAGEMVVTGPINSDKYMFYIQAKVCEKNLFSVEMQIIITTLDDDTPQWEQLMYNVALNDNVDIGTEVVRVKAYELGRGAENLICHYQITSAINVPFYIDVNGVIRTTNHLDARKNTNYVLRVTAFDCRLPAPRNSSINVNIAIKESCKYGWNGIYDQIKYKYSDGIRQLGSSLKFSDCHKSLDQCHDQEVIAQLTLHGSNMKICARDFPSLHHQWKSCGMNNDTTELFPSKDNVYPSTGILTFDGANSQWDVPTNRVPSDHFLGDNFTISFWMKHTKLDDDYAHKKEQILCNSDGNRKNRHHYSLFLHNCKLILLYRTESSSVNEGQSSLSPAEWRFKSAEMCDEKWHHYSLIVETGKVTSQNNKISTLPNNLPSRRVKLFIDGAMFPYDTNNPEIIDDIPMRTMAEVYFTKLSIGACWHSRSFSYIQHFKGQLAGITVLRGKSESASVIECINHCHERLTFTGIREMAAGTSISINAFMSSMTITASNVNDVAKIIDQMGYINARWNPLLGMRTIELRTSIKCSNNIRFQIPKNIIQVIVSPNNKQMKSLVHTTKEVLHVAGDESLTIDSENIVSPVVGSGLSILPNVTISFAENDGLGFSQRLDKYTTTEERKLYRIKGQRKISSCMLTVDPLLNKQHEYLIFTNSIVKDLSDQGIYLNVTNSSRGLIIEGIQSLSIYKLVLQRIVYFNSQLDQFQDKIFKLVCSQKNSVNIVSNELVIKLGLASTVVANRHVHTVHTYIPMDQVEHKGKSEIAGFRARSDSIVDLKTAQSSQVAIILIICGVMVLLVTTFVLLRIVKYRHRRLSRSVGEHWMRHKQKGLKFSLPKNIWFGNESCRHLSAQTPSGELEWDNSEHYTSSVMDESLQITVNPLLEHEISSRTNSRSATNIVPLDNDDKSLDGLPDEYDGQSEDFRDVDDDLTVDEDLDGAIEDNENIHFYQNGKSFSHNAIYDNSRDRLGPVNIYSNPRFENRKKYSN